MKNGLTIGFEFHEDFYYSLVEVNELDGCTEYQIMLMDNQLTHLSAEDHVIREKDGYLQLRDTESEKYEPLKMKVAESLSQFLHKPIISADPSKDGPQV